MRPEGEEEGSCGMAARPCGTLELTKSPSPVRPTSPPVSSAGMGDIDIAETRESVLAPMVEEGRRYILRNEVLFAAAARAVTGRHLAY